MDQARTISPEDVLVTERLYQREARAADLTTELRAYRELSSLMTVDANLAIQRFLDLAVELCPAAGSAGLSELGSNGGGEAVFTWTAMSGALSPYVGGTTPRDFSPCGLCLDAHHPIIVERPARAFPYFLDANPQITEGLIVPLYDTGKRPLGTLWVTSHADDSTFDATDARVMEQLAVQLVLAIKLRTKAHLRSTLERAVREKDILIEEVRHRVKNTIQMTSALLHLQEKGVHSEEARGALREAQSRLLVLASVYESLLQPGGDGRQVDVAPLIEALVMALRDGSPHGDRIEFDIDCPELLLNVAQAAPLGLIVNEAITNALKHGFATGQAGTIVVTIRKAGSVCTLAIHDNGCGFAGPVRDGSLGMRLMHSLARQLGGTLGVDGSAGTHVRLEWPAEDEQGAEQVEPAAEMAPA